MSSVKTVFGSMEIARRADMKESKKMLDVFHNYGGREIDTAYVYGLGKTEVYLGDLKDEISKDFEYATKANPYEERTLNAGSVRLQLETSLERLKRKQVDIYYLHAPDHVTPLTETLKIIDVLHKEGKFSEFGLSNYSAWQVAEIVNLCKQNGWIQPTVYQGMYNILERLVEKELISCLRYYKIRFYAYSPLASGILTGKHKMEHIPENIPSRFSTGKFAAVFRNLYWRPEYFDAVEDIRTAVSSVYGFSVSLTEVAMRWIYHHSALKGECGDAVILGASSAKQLEDNLEFTKKGPLDPSVVSVIENTWKFTMRICRNYGL
uniref:aflatoxin B1 aldehyde reductase member 2-like n=1 Tax=Styela clava TaxID=7725 RepID=UPI00193A308B|nr:aflatoxin B1 aldehyde reductase member 2-like [Styela clava]